MEKIVVDENFVLKIPSNLNLAATAPLLCAGITVYSPMLHYQLNKNQKFAVVGLGGLGHMAVKFGVALGVHTTVISRGKAKMQSALTELKADSFLDSTDEVAMKNAADSFDFVLNTVSAKYSLKTYLDLVAVDGKMVLVGIPPEDAALNFFSLIGFFFFFLNFKLIYNNNNIFF
jgi:D-arabinose 1-dehydrogenase-like Zn-dependent alcohol dehydrogenase